MKDHFFQYLCKRLYLGLLTLLIILFASYALLRLAPGDPSKSSFLAGGDGSAASSTGMMDSDKSSMGKNVLLEKKLNLDKPLLVGFFLWMKDAVQGDFGTSVSVDKGRPVWTLIKERLPVTLRLNILAILLTYLLAVPVGIQTAVRADSKFDRLSTFFLFFLYSLPVLWTALMLQAVFCKGGMFPVFPLKGLTPTVSDGMSTWKIMLLYVLVL